MVDDIFKKSPALDMAFNVLPKIFGKDTTAPMLADKFMEDLHAFVSSVKIGKARAAMEKHALRYKIAMRKANRFVMEDDLVELATEISMNTPVEKLAQRIHSAVLPFETTWLEFNLRTKVATSIRLSENPSQKVASSVPERAGMLLQRDVNNPAAWSFTMVSTISDGEFRELNLPLPMTFLFDPSGVKGPIASYRPITTMPEGLSKEWMNACPWGYTLPDGETHRMVVPKDLEGVAAVGTAPMFLEVLQGKDRLDRFAKLFEDVLEEHIGMLRWAVTVLAMLAEVPTKSSGLVEPKASRLIGTMNRPYMDYHRLSIKLPKTKALQYVERKLDKGEFRRRRAHEVRTHWRNYLSVKPCKVTMPDIDPHSWEYDHANGYRLCAGCLSSGRLIKEHVRGDPKLGWVRKEYSLEKA